MKKFRRRGGNGWLYVALIIVLLGAYSYWTISRPLPDLKPIAATAQLQSPTAPSKLVWPTIGQSAVGMLGSSIVEVNGTQKSVPTASTAKLITALVVLRQKPLTPGEQGPIITLSANDVAIYNSYARQQGSVVQVVAGEQISEYQMLEAMLLPSANNMADSLAIWAFGSLPAYTDSANTYVGQLGLAGTHIGSDASGFAPSTISTAHDLVELGELTMQNSVLSQIVSQTSAGGIPVANTIKNVNFLIGTDNIIGVKTGNTDQAGGVFVSASHTTVNKKPVTIITALTGSPTLFQAMRDSLPLIQSAQINFQLTPVISQDATVGYYQQPWGGKLAAVASKNLSVNAPRGQPILSTIHLRPVPATTLAGQTVGSLVISKSAIINQNSIPVILKTPPTKPPLLWRLLHP